MYFDSVLRMSIFKFFVKYSLILISATILPNILTLLPTASAIAGFVMIFSSPSFLAWFIPIDVLVDPSSSLNYIIIPFTSARK